MEESITRSQSLIYTLPHTTESLNQFLLPQLERVEGDNPATQLLIITPDAESAVIIAESVLRTLGPQGIEVIPATSPGRAARLMDGRPARVIAGPPSNLKALLSTSTLKLEGLSTVVFAWPEDILESPDENAALDALMAEVPKDAGRLLVTRSLTPAVEQLAERYMWKARRIGPETTPGQGRPKRPRRGEGEDTPAPLALQYVSVARSARPAALRRVLDELDPPSALIVVRSPESEAEARQAVMSLGYRRSDDPVQVFSGEAGVAGVAPLPSTHTVILYDSPATNGELHRVVAAAPVTAVTLVQPRDLAVLKELSGEMATLQPFSLPDVSRRARQKDEAIRHELRQVLQAGIPAREAIALEPLIADHDALEVAAAALRLLERERERMPVAVGIPAAPAPMREKRERGDRGPKRDRFEGGRGDRDTRDRRGTRDRGGFRGSRDDRGERRGDDRPKRSFRPRPR